MAEARHVWTAVLASAASPRAHSGRRVIAEEPLRLPIEDALDLHAFAPRDVASVVEEYLVAAHERGLRDVRLIHGRGIGVQRSIVHAVLSRHPLVVSFAEAPAERGGWGATVVRLREA